ncbi:hypothetical protein TUM4438_45720 [Shewanella sairae]|uniref:Integrin n=1 Tax=Shewanella sairae TaxID=190310 RepID=A0ABQ4PRV8_9GAMM|nr:DUF6386 family protein [Shewanella sairae]MCL1132569.1 DUF6386 family protein [Shewanella sairae]GIU52605.1 hypothetical protein TUM4438_45720 [Shewanella sairae]
MSLYKFATDTSTLCVFDLKCLKHKLCDDVDWWSIQSDALAEMNKGNVAFIGLLEDGLYSFKIVDEVLNSKVEINLNVPSGTVFVGAGEEVTADEFEPECLRGGVLLDLEPGKYTLKSKVEHEVILLSFKSATGSFNTFKGSINLDV